MCEWRFSTRYCSTDNLCQISCCRFKVGSVGGEQPAAAGLLPDPPVPEEVRAHPVGGLGEVHQNEEAVQPRTAQSPDGRRVIVSYY